MYPTVERHTLRAIGVSDAVLRTAVGCCLLRLCRGVFALSRRCDRADHALLADLVPEGCALPDPGGMSRYERREAQLATRIEAMRTRLGPRQVFSHYSAALLHELPLSGPVPELAEVSGPGDNKRHAMHRTWRRPDIPEADTVLRERTPCTSVALTIIDVARNHSPSAALGMADHALRSGLLSREGLELSLERSGYRARLNGPRTVLLLSDGRRESVGESRCALLFHRLGIAGLIPQYEIRDCSGRFVARVDFADPVRRIIVEFDGLAKYGMHRSLSERQVLENEKARQDALMALGWRVIRLTWRDIGTSARYLSKLAPLMRR